MFSLVSENAMHDFFGGFCLKVFVFDEKTAVLVTKHGGKMGRKNKTGNRRVLRGLMLS